MGGADVEISAGFLESDLFRLALVQSTRVPIADLAFVESSGGVRDVADIGEGDGGSRLDPSAGRPVGVLNVIVTDLNLIDAVGECASRPGDGLRGWWRP